MWQPLRPECVPSLHNTSGHPAAGGPTAYTQDEVPPYIWGLMLPRYSSIHPAPGLTWMYAARWAFPIKSTSPLPAAPVTPLLPAHVLAPCLQVGLPHQDCGGEGSDLPARRRAGARVEGGHDPTFQPSAGQVQGGGGEGPEHPAMPTSDPLLPPIPSFLPSCKSSSRCSPCMTRTRVGTWNTRWA